MNLGDATGKRIKELLFEKNMTQYKLQKITCLNEKTLRDLTNGKTKDVKLSTIFLIANAFEMSISEFVSSPLFDQENIET